MDGASGRGGGVTLLSGSGIFAGDSITLTSGARTWRIRIPSSKESASNTLIIEVKQGASWLEARSFIIAD